MAAALWWNSVAVKGNVSPVGEDSTFGAKPLIAGEVPSTMDTQLSEASGVVAESAAQSPMVAGTPPNVSVREAVEVRVGDIPYPALAIPTPSLVQAASLRIQQVGGQLTESEVVAILREAGWPESLFAEALAVSFCESQWSPYALGDGGRSVGLFQVNKATWFPYAGEDPELWANPVVNARVALQTYYYDLRRGYPAWKQWSCKPMKGGDAP